MGGTVSLDLAARISVSVDWFTVTVDLAVPEGRTLALLGPNGAGKSTIVSVLAGLRRIDEGRIRLGDRILDDPDQGLFVPPTERRVGVVFQDHLLFPHLSVVDNVAFGARRRGMARRPAHTLAESWLERLGVRSVASARPAALSGGQAQRVALARALAAEPELLLLDEPLSSLDVSARAGVRRVLAEHLDGFAGPRLFITHDPTEAFLLGDEVAIVEGGRLTQQGTPDELRLRPRTAYAADLAGANLLVGRAGAGIVKVEGRAIRVGDTAIEGPVLATIQPRAISVHRNRPEGSPRNTWQTTVASIEHYGDRVRIDTSGPPPLTAEITPGAVEALGLAEGDAIWLSIKATEIGVEQG